MGNKKTLSKSHKENISKGMMGKSRPEYVCDKISKTMRDKFASGELFRKKKYVA